MAWATSPCFWSGAHGLVAHATGGNVSLVVHGLGIVLIVLLAGGCGSPNKANIELRKQNQELRNQIEQLKREKKGDAASVAALESRVGVLPTLPHERLEQLFTTHGLQLGRLTGGGDFNRNEPGDEGLKIHAVPIDQTDDEFKAAGAFVVEVFDLAEPAQPAIGRWEFSTEQAKQHWYGSIMLNEYVLECPWQKVPGHEELTIKVTFTDELTQRAFTAQKIVKVELPPAGEKGI